jgi:hypothetical protein
MQTTKKVLLGLSVAAFFAAAATSAMAGTPRWVVCVKEGGKWMAGCTKAGTEWATKELVGTEEVTSSGELELEDSKATGGAVDIKCKESGTGWIANPKSTSEHGEDGISKITSTGCTFVKAGECETGKAVTIKPRNLPWATRLISRGSEARDELLSGGKKEEGEGEPGWAVECTVAGILKTTDRCEHSGNTVGVTANRTEGTVEGKFDERTAEETMATCSVGGAGAGLVRGTLAIKASKGAVWVENPPEFEGPSWLVGGDRLGNGEEKAVTLSSKAGAVFKIRSINGSVKMECTGASGSGDIIGSGAAKVGTDMHKLEFTGCTDVAEKECEIISYVNKEKESKPAGKIGPVSIKTELIFLGNAGNHATAGDLFYPLEENTEAKFGVGAPEKVFVVIEFKEKPLATEECKEKGKRFSLLGLSTGGPAAELWIGGKDARANEEAESVELRFPPTQYKWAEKWNGENYAIEAIEFQWINEAKTLQTLEIEGTMIMTFAGKAFGWVAR